MASDHDLHDANDDAKDAAQSALFRRHVADDADDVTIDLADLPDSALNDYAQLLTFRFDQQLRAARDMMERAIDRQKDYADALKSDELPWWHMWNAGEAFQHPDNTGARENFVGPFETEVEALADNAAGPVDDFERLAPGDADPC